MNNEQGLKEGLLFQSDEDRFILGEPPFAFHKKPVKGFYLPGFFFENPRPWIEARRLVFLRRAELERFINSLPKASKNNETFGKSANAHSPLLALSSLHASLNERAANPQAALVALQKPSFTAFFNCFMEIKREIRAGALQKAVPVFFERLKTEPAALLKAFFRLSRCKSGGFLYGFWNKNGGIVGLTPEFLFSKSGERGRIMALAATGPHPGPSLLRDPKELKEHAFVLQGVRRSLTSFWTEESRSLQEKPFFNIKHLRAVLNGRLKGGFEEICQVLHPTPALGGFPQKPAWKRLTSMPKQKQRGLFGSPFGFFDGKENGLCLAAIRCVQWINSRSAPHCMAAQDRAPLCGSAFIGSGCGITDLSLAQKEYRELLLKRETVKKLFFRPPEGARRC